MPEENPGGIPVSEEELNPTIPRLESAEEIIIDYVAQSRPRININILLSLLKDLVEEFGNEEVQLKLTVSKRGKPISLSAILDYIMTTPENFNPNILREALTNEDALHALTATYMEKMGMEESGESGKPSLGPIGEDPGRQENV